MRYRRMPIEVESPEQLGYDTIAHNLSESSVADRSLDDLGLDLDLGSLALCYGDHLGDPALRDQIARAGPRLAPDDVLVTPGAAAALFAVSTSQLGPGDHAVVVRTNYATNIETPLAIGADVDYLDLRFEDGYRLDLDRLAALVHPGTKLVSITVPHNPTGTMCTRDELDAVIDLTERVGATLLSDETYRDLTHGEALPLAASLSERAVSIASLSKAYGLPGLRVGWAITRDDRLRETLLAAKEQIVICGATLDETIAAAVLADRDRILPPIRATVTDHLERVTEWVEGEPRLEWVRPEGGVVCFPRIGPDVPIDVDRFYDVLLARYGTYVGPGHWFDADRRHFRLGYGWPTTADLDAGLAAVSKALDDRVDRVMGPTPADVRAAAARIAGHVHRTPIMTSRSLDRMAGAELFFKCENLQRIGAFKIRGATNTVLSLTDEQAARGVACHSSGNHGQALALAARIRGINAHVVMPVNVSAVKRAAVAGYGARIIDCEPTEASRNATVEQVVAETGAMEIHPFDDDRIIAGQGTAALELLEDGPPLDTVVAPVGGGGLLSGTALAVAGHDTARATTAVYGAEPAAADDAQRSFRTGHLHPSDRPQTVADGLLTSLSPRTLTVLRARVADIVTVEEGAIIEAMRLLWERTKLLVEPSAAVAPAAVLAELVPGRRIGVILSGGNVDLDRLPWITAGAAG